MMSITNRQGTAAQRVVALIEERQRTHPDAGLDVWNDVIVAQPDYDADATEWMDPRGEHGKAFFRDGSVVQYGPDIDVERWQAVAMRACVDGQRAVRYENGQWRRLLNEAGTGS